jgi:hypothetical protein
MNRRPVAFWSLALLPNLFEDEDDDEHEDDYD